MLCYVMLYNVIKRYVMIAHVMLCYAVKFYAMLCYAMLCYFIPCFVMLQICSEDLPATLKLILFRPKLAKPSPSMCYLFSKKNEKPNGIPSDCMRLVFRKSLASLVHVAACAARRYLRGAAPVLRAGSSTPVGYISCCCLYGVDTCGCAVS